MSNSQHRLAVFSPLPAQQNGIADYTAMLLQGLVHYYDCTAFAADPRAQTDFGIGLQAADAASTHWRGQRILHQIGNNPDHGFVIAALRRLSGVVTLHDPGLFYLHESSGADHPAMIAGMMAQHPGLGDVFGRHWQDRGWKTGAVYALFDLLPGLLAAARGVVVHSRYALGRLRAIHGQAATRHVSVIPHLAPVMHVRDRAAARHRLGIGQDEFVVASSGFATNAKRFDWQLAAMEQALSHGVRLRFIHAGEERPWEYPLTERLLAHPLLARCSQVTGYVDAATLDAHIAACDVLLNLRFPSAGESSGSLARAMVAGACGIVSDIAAYAELPRDAVLHIPVLNTVPALATALVALHANRGLARQIGDAARRYALAEMALPSVARRYRDAIEAAQQRPLPPLPAPATPNRLRYDLATLDPTTLKRDLAAVQGRCWLVLDAADETALAAGTLRWPGLLRDVLTPNIAVQNLRLVAGARPALHVTLSIAKAA